ncbi:MAG: PAS domain S-box protein, partial [Desulfobacterales bacterium]|nr:PAS domain S-box protein [Desulfobacterales bacterium]MDX2512910.1 PAS domain S-box protein [Desulfobacterales bacterium]
MNNQSFHNSHGLENAGQLEACDIPQDRYRVFIQDVADAFFETTIQGDFVFFNDALCRIFGYPREEIIHKNFRHFMDSVNAKYAFNSFKNMFDTGKGVNNILWEIYRKDGDTRILEINANLLEDTNGKKVGFQGIARDITDKVRAEQALKASEKQTQEQYTASRRAEQRYRS